MCNLICDFISCCVWSCHKINSSDKIMFENQKKKRKYENKTTCKRSLRHRIHSLLRPADARGSADIILTYLTHFASLRVRQLLRSKSRSRIEWLLQTNNIIMLDSYCNLTNKSNLNEHNNDIIRPNALMRFNTIFWSFGSGLLFWGHPVH